MSSRLEEGLGYAFSDDRLLTQALTHSSLSGEADGNYERLEFLGDAILGFAAGEELFRRLPEAPEGRLTKLRSQVVRESTIAGIGRRLGLGELARMSGGQEKQGGRDNDSIIADMFEAVIGAVYLDSDFYNARSVVLRLTEKALDDAIAGKLSDDYKSRLQEWAQARGYDTPVYELTADKGPGHDKTFFVDVSVNGRVMGTGKGKTKKKAEQSAARQGLERIR